MDTIILYFIKVSISVALFYGLYMFLLRKDTFFRIRRFYFLFAMIFSLVFPLLTIEIPTQIDQEAEAPVYVYWLSQIDTIGGIQAAEQETRTSIDIWDIILICSIAITIIMAVRFIIQLCSIVKLRISNETEKVSSYKIINVKDKSVSPFSFFRWIFICLMKYNPKELNEIIEHEQVHVRQYHSIDVIMAEIMCILLWWNPFMWLFRNEIKINLEYLADQGVLKAGYDTKEYQYILLQGSEKRTEIPLINNFNVSQLKKRITMMNKKRTSIGKASIYLMAIPVGIALLLGNAVQATPDLSNLFGEEVKITDYNIAETDILIENAVLEGLQDGKPLTKAEQMPSYPGGDAEMNKFIAENLRYPVTAQEAGIQGRVTVRFVVKKTGEITDVTVVRGVDKTLDAEAKRVIKAMPKWTPGKQNGQNVDVYFMVPMVFKIKEGNNTTKKTETTATQQKKSDSDDKKPSANVEEMPQFPGGQDELNKFIGENMKYPIKAQESGVQGRVITRFIVSATGDIKDVTIIRSIDKECDAEAKRVIESMPKWIPGKQNGKNVDVYFILPLVFKLRGGGIEEKTDI
ncbi:MAG: M56 family metallopeptidase [Prevotella sp.]|jgi:TonB family protein|nr:M56 family metallopeptidase [Prevotella sp.]